jgi:hypothetical protein
MRPLKLYHSRPTVPEKGRYERVAESVVIASRGAPMRRKEAAGVVSTHLSHGSFLLHALVEDVRGGLTRGKKATVVDFLNTSLKATVCERDRQLIWPQ